MTKRKQRDADGVDVLLRSLRLPSFVAHHEEVASTAEKQGWSFGQYLYHLAEQEVADREQRRITRLLKQSKLPTPKTLATLDLDHLPAKVRRQVPTLCEGGFVERAENVLSFGLPGRGKTQGPGKVVDLPSIRGDSSGTGAARRFVA